MHSKSRFSPLRIALLFALMVGCGPRLVNVAAPVQPEHLGTFRQPSAETPVIVQLPNFTIREIDAQYSEDDDATFRRITSVSIPNALQELIGKRQVFSEVSRVPTATPAQADYIISGTYDFFQRLGTQGREWIPFAGTFGAPINEAWIKANLDIRVTDARSGLEIFRKSYPEEHQERTSVYKKASVTYLQPDYLGAISSDVVGAIQSSAGSRSGDGSTQKAATPESSTPARTTSLENRLRELQELHKSGLITDAEYSEQRTKALNDALGH